MLHNKQIILFDGVCNLCNSLVLFVIRHDKTEKFKFCSLQSETGQSILQHNNISSDNIDTFVLLLENQVHTKSTASLKLLKELGGIWNFFYICILIPRPIRDYFYDAIAHSRYKIFGKRDFCMTPSEKLKNRFLE